MMCTRCCSAEHAKDGASNSTQYIFLDDTLVAPIWDSTANTTTRSVWVPPGDWEDAWDGSTVSGPKMVEASQPYEKQPMWHKKSGGLTVITDEPGLRIDDQDWSSLTLEAFPAQVAQTTQRSVFALKTEARQDITMTTDGNGNAHFDISESEDGAERAWVVRLHLLPNQRATMATIDEEEMAAESLVHLAPLSAEQTSTAHFPFGGAGAHPPQHAGHVAELRLPSAAHARTLSVTITGSN